MEELKQMSQQKNRITVKIYEKEFTFLHDETDDYIHRLANYLNGKIGEEIKKGIRQGDITPVVMAAINITDELFKMQKNYNTLKNEIKRIMDEYDNIKNENKELEEQLIAASDRLDKLQKELLVKEVEFNEYKKFSE
jgi:cell division protein ZapA